MKKVRTFAFRLTMPSSIKVFIVAAFFVSAHQNSLGCCIPSDSRCKALLSLAKSGNDSLFLLNIFKPTMPSSIKNANKLNNSTLVSTPNGAKSAIRLTISGVSNNHYLYALRKAIYEFLEEETKGHCCTELRLVKKYEAAVELFPEDRKKLRGKTIEIY